MAEADFYRVLGLSPGASADAVKGAYRDLVKKYHPDLFHTAALKAQATEKLRQINEAYAVLGDAERRREYDEKRLQRQPAPARPATAPPRRRRQPERPVEQSRRYAFSPKLAVALLGVTVLAFVALAVHNEPEPATVWVLFEKTVFEPPQSTFGRKPAAPDWGPLGRYGSKAECAGNLKEWVRKDEREGSKSILDERDGTMAITVQIKAAAALAQPDERSESGLTKRVKNYECRQLKLPRSESWLRRALRRQITNHPFQ